MKRVYACWDDFNDIAVEDLYTTSTGRTEEKIYNLGNRKSEQNIMMELDIF